MMEFLRTFTESLNEVLAYCNVASTGSMCTDARLYRATVQSQGGLCYTFNGEKLQDPNITQIYSDSVGTLGAITFLLQHRPHRYFYPFLTEGYNIYLHVQEAGPGVTGIFALPGKVTAVAIEKNRIKNLEISEGGKCERRTIKAFKKYSQIHCYFECASDFIKDKCVCRPVNLGEYNDATVCYNSYKNCTDYFSSQLDYGTCDCPIACDETTYKTSVSYGQLPRSSIFGINQVFFDGFSPDDYVAISVYFGSHRDVTYRQHSTFGPTSLFGEIGGNMGFLLGCSLMTLVEFVVLMWSFVMNYFQQRGQVRDLNPQPKVGWN